MITGRELLIAYDMEKNKIIGATEEEQRLFSEKAVDHYLRFKEKI